MSIRSARLRTFAMIAALGAILGGSTVAHATESPAPRSGDLSAHTYYWDRFDKKWYLNGAYPCELDTSHDYRNPSWPIDLINTTQCHRRVWLYANLDKSGEKKCIPPGSARKITDHDLKMAMILRIGAKGGCP
ncbi:hypothetical protein [Streptomyces sp. NPDC001816]|uniref:hypothetical protein n=1 Tax=Streptomyces sp. NPDC001816 TaxID=3364612 RepID=UPI0036CCA285